MSAGVFSEIGKLYLQAAGNGFYFTGQRFWLTRPVWFLIALLYAGVLASTGLVFYLFIVLDWLGNITNSIRKSLLNAIERHSQRIPYSFLSFLFRPVFIALLSPLFLISILIPKLSSNAAAQFALNEASDAFSGAGAFRRLNTSVFTASKNLFRYVANASILAMPIVGIIAIVYSLVLIAIGLVFAILIPLDWLSQLVEAIRRGIVAFVNAQQRKIRYHTAAFLFIPIILTVLAPIFLLLLLVPKFTSQLETEV